MFYRMVEKASRRWYGNPDCPATPIVSYIEAKGSLRDAQIEAIKTYLFLKLACSGRPLYELFLSGTFNSIDFNNEELTNSTRDYMTSHPAAAALYEYASQVDDTGATVASKLVDILKRFPETIDCDTFFRNAFYGVNYPDYLFSLPMGAGKTFLMSAFIFLDLYFAKREPLNPAFAHNFIVFAPSGLKSSVVPSLRTIQNFDVSWVLPDPAASELKKNIFFEVLDQPKTTGKSNKTKNPNVQKIASHQPINELFGLIAVTNAEKVILDRIEEKDIFELSEDEKVRYKQANELRDLIGSIPSLSVFIDEVHHAVRDDIKLRQVVSAWAEKGNVNSVLGFSGTPYLGNPETIAVNDTLSVKTIAISNIVYYYPLVNGVDNFLKRPVIKISDNTSSEQIIESGIRDFLTDYKDVIYEGGLCAKLGIYCGTIEKLETVVYPLASRLTSEYGLSPDVILKFHRGDKKYPAPQDGQLKFETLDTSLSDIRIILLVQIGKEGWDCRSLTGVILSQEGDCPTNMVLQTSCRCLRQVSKGKKETALIYLNQSNARILERQLEQEQHTTIEEIQKEHENAEVINRFDRRIHLKLPPVDFYQMSVSFDIITSESADPATIIPTLSEKCRQAETVITTTDLSLKDRHYSIETKEAGWEPANYSHWLASISRESLGTLSIHDLLQYDKELRAIFDTITIEKDGYRCFNSKYDKGKINAGIRTAFADKRGFCTREETLPEQASLLNIRNFTTKLETNNPERYYPNQDEVKKIIKADKGELVIKPDILMILQQLERLGKTVTAQELKKEFTANPNKERSFHYLPYHFDSDFEQQFLEQILSQNDLEDFKLEVYYNGDRGLSDFRIKCYKKTPSGREYIGIYTPDFLVIQRKDNTIHKIVIVETKGKIYANDPVFKDKRSFMENDFSELNNKAFGYKRFDYLYLEDTIPENDRVRLTHDKIISFFGGED